MNNLEFIRQNGNIPKTLAGKDHISGILFYVDSSTAEKFASQRVHLCSSLESAAQLEIVDTDDAAWDIKMMHYHLSEIYRTNPGVTLYIGIFSESTTQTFAEVKQMQNYARGDIRQLGIWNGGKLLNASDITTLQGVATTLESEDMPLSMLYAPKISALNSLPINLAGEGKKNISVIIGQDGAGVAATLQSLNGAATRCVTGLGTFLGLLSKAKVHESIAWVGNFPAGIAEPAFADGSIYRNLDKGVIETLDNAKYLFFRTYSNYPGSYVNDSYNLDNPISDYCTIELVRTMDKAIRGIRTYLLPELGSPVEIDPATGQLHPATVKHLETVANQQLIDMERAGELSGFNVTIDPDQDVLATSTIEFVIQNVPKGVFRKGRVLIGYSKSINN